MSGEMAEYEFQCPNCEAEMVRVYDPETLGEPENIHVTDAVSQFELEAPYDHTQRFMVEFYDCESCGKQVAVPQAMQL